MKNAEEFVSSILEKADITINGDKPWDITVHNEQLFKDVLLRKNLALGEGYMLNWWDCEAPDEFINKILTHNLHTEIRENFRDFLYILPSLIFNRQSSSRARIIAERHYDLGNKLFESFLDPYMQYSCGYFYDKEDLETAQKNKMDLTCKKLQLNENDTLLDIGCGWGGFAKYAAENYGCKVVGVNISERQIEYGSELCKDLPVEIVNSDYREIKGKFDKVVSIGMFEHVGPKNYKEFMNTVKGCMKPDGIFLLHTIGSNTSSVNCDPWVNKYIFPNGTLPSIAQIARAAENRFVIEDLHNFGPHYDRTLMHWHNNFLNSWRKLENDYDETFKRMWEYYLLSSAGGFRARHLQLWQIVFTHERKEQPFCRFV